MDNKNKLQYFLQTYPLQTVQFIEFKTEKVAQFPRKSVDHVSLVTYYRLFLPELLPNSINKILFLDPDMLIRTKIAPLWQINIENYSIVAVENPNAMELKKRLLIPPTASYFNAGVLLINLNYWRTRNITKKLLFYLKNNQSKLRFWDQDVLNAVLWNSCRILEEAWNTIDTTQVSQPKIIHFIGARKPWHLKNKHPYRAEYFDYLKKTPWKNYSPYWEYIQRVANYYYGQYFKRED